MARCIGFCILFSPRRRFRGRRDKDRDNLKKKYRTQPIIYIFPSDMKPNKNGYIGYNSGNK